MQALAVRLWSRFDLPPNTRRLVWAQGLYTIANGLSGAFVGVFLWRLGHRLVVVGEFHLMLFTFTALGIQLATGIANRWGSVLVLVAGLGLHALFYLTVLAVGPRAADVVLLLGAMNGLALAFYAAGVNTLSYDLTEDHQREAYFSLAGIFNTLASLVSPLLSGFVIAHVPGLGGYRLVFALTLTLFLLTASVARVITQPRTTGTFRPGRALKPGSANPRWPAFLASYLFVGWREGVFWFVMGVLLFQVLGSEWILGMYLAMFAAITVLAYFLVGRFLTPAARIQAVRVGVALHVGGTLAASLFFDKLGFLTYMIVGGSFGIVIWQVPFTNLCFECIGRDPEASALRLEYIAVRELPLGLGRVLGILSFLLLAQFMPEAQALRLLFPVWVLPLLALPLLAKTPVPRVRRRLIRARA